MSLDNFEVISSTSSLLSHVIESTSVSSNGSNSLLGRSYYDKCQLKDPLLNNFAVRVILSALYVIVFAVAISGNLLVVYVVLFRKKMRTVTNMFIMNLAASDLIVSGTSLWVTPMYTFVGRWIWGGFMCHGLPLFQGASIFNSSLTLMAIAIERYYVILHHSNSININDHMTMKTCICIICLIWSVSMSIVTPLAVNMNISVVPAPCNFLVCMETWDSKMTRMVYGFIVMFLQFVLPVVLIGISYRLIWKFMNTRRWMSERAVEAKRRKRLLRMLCTMVTLFVVCWLPFNLLNIVRDFGVERLIRPFFPSHFIFSHLISMTATCWNPILYAWMNDSFREEFRRTIQCISTKDSARKKVISECRPAHKRVNCVDSIDSRRRSSFQQPVETMLLSQEIDNRVTTKI